MALANLNTSDFIKGSGVTQTGRVIEITGGGGGLQSGTASGTDTYAVTVGGSERTLIAFVANEADPGVPSGYTGSFTDNYTGIYLECNTKENVSSDGSVTDGGGSVAWASFHISIRNGSTRSFIVN